jgi:hypothetical protein
MSKAEPAKQIVPGVELDGDELACRILEAFVGIRRPFGWSAAETLGAQAPEARRAASAAIRHFDGSDFDELASRILEVIVGARRPAGMSGAEALARQPKHIQTFGRRAAHAAARYFREVGYSGQSVMPSSRRLFKH